MQQLARIPPRRRTALELAQLHVLLAPLSRRIARGLGRVRTGLAELLITFRIVWGRARAAIRRRARRAELEEFVDNVAACACHGEECHCRDDFPGRCARPRVWPAEAFWWGRIPRCRMLEAMRALVPGDVLPTRAQWMHIRELATRLCHVPDCRCVELRLGLELDERPPACRRAEALAELLLSASRPGYRG